MLHLTLQLYRHMDVNRKNTSVSGDALVTYGPDVIECVNGVLGSYCSIEKGEGGIELEVVIGERKHGRFVAGMDFTDFLSIYGVRLT